MIILLLFVFVVGGTGYAIGFRAGHKAGRLENERQGFPVLPPRQSTAQAAEGSVDSGIRPAGR